MSSLSANFPKNPLLFLSVSITTPRAFFPGLFYSAVRFFLLQIPDSSFGTRKVLAFYGIFFSDAPPPLSVHFTCVHTYMYIHTSLVVSFKPYNRLEVTSKATTIVTAQIRYDTIRPLFPRFQ